MRVVNAAFAEQKATIFCASRIKSQPIRVVIPVTRNVARQRSAQKNELKMHQSRKPLKNKSYFSI